MNSLYYVPAKFWLWYYQLWKGLYNLFTFLFLTPIHSCSQGSLIKKTIYSLTFFSMVTLPLNVLSWVVYNKYIFMFVFTKWKGINACQWYNSFIHHNVDYCIPFRQARFQSIFTKQNILKRSPIVYLLDDFDYRQLYCLFLVIVSSL